MQRETKRRIAYYQEALPNMKEKVAAAALMLLISVIVTVTATYAWVTLSIAPVVSSVNTTVSSNGNLEIALAPEDGSLPEEFDVDESASASTDVTVSNLQWGNLINLSDPAYGIDNLVLRPAQLNSASLKYSPLWGAVYGADGRISTLDSNYTYTKWDGSEFLASKEYGVRAIASYKLTTSESTSAAYKTMADAVNTAHNKVNNAYALVPEKVGGVSSMLSSFVQSKVPAFLGGGSETAFTSAQIKSAYELYKAFLDAMELQKDALVALANFQSFVYAQNPDNGYSYEELFWADLVANKAAYNASNATTASSNGIISLVGLTQFISDYDRAVVDVEYLKTYYEGAADGSMKIYWSSGGTSGHQIVDIVDYLLSYNNLTVVINGETVTFAQLAGNPTGYATDLVGMNGDHTNATVQKGSLQRFEQTAIDESYRLQGQSNNAVLTVKVNVTMGVSMTITIYGDCYTSASGPSSFMSNYSAAMGQEMVGADAVAEDTYGMAVDFWIRTNAEDTYLTLEGAVAADTDGTVYGYDGVNRVWGSTNVTNLTTNSTTQGSGSCYIYYADTPEDMARSLELLQSMKVAFVDADGNLVASASMDTQNYYAVNGRVTVPLAIDENSGVSYTYTDDTNLEQTGRAIVRLTNDDAKWVTALIYLDGANMSNESVLAAADIDGQLNIQFGSSADLNTLGDNKLLVEERTVVAEVSKTKLDYINASSAEDLTTDVTVRVDGSEPDTVTAFFLRAVNSTQGERQDTMTFTKQADGTWTASYAFDAPGTYYLRYVRLDGVDYVLTDPPMVEVSGFAVQSISWGEISNVATVYSPDNYYTEPVTVRFASTSASQMPSSVQARFLRADGNMVNVDMTYNSSTGAWSGTGTFYTSGTYSLQYLLLDGEYYDVAEKGYVLNLSLGLNVAVYNNGSSTNDMYDANAAQNAYTKNVGVKIFDNSGSELKAMEGARLRYSLGGSATNTVDTDLVWDDANDWYTGTLPIVKPGRYTYLEVNIEGSRLTKATEAPTYVIISPDPPIYQVSESHYYDEVQFAPLTNDAYIGPITIDNSASATIAAVVHNDITGEDYTITMSDTQTQNGTMYYENGKWYINLPVYTDDVDKDGNPLENAVYTQEGTWTVQSISIWDCYDEDSVYRDETSPIVWTAETSDFSKLTTEVSCSINVSMEAGTTALGSADADFMADNYVKNIGMYVALTDNSGRTIPAEKVKDITLNVSYTANTDADTYGYEVASGANRSYTIKLNSQDAETGYWLVNADSNDNWQYVGQYVVSNLTVTMANGSTLVSNAGQNGVAKEYTVKSSAPTVENLAISAPIQNQTTFGMTGNNVTGTFLQSYGGASLAALDISLTPTDANGNSYARMPEFSVTLNLLYKNGSTAPNGGYSWTDTNPLTDIDLAMTNVNTSTNRYVAGSSSLLAGDYELSATVTMGGETTSVGGWQRISVYSVKPEVTMTSVEPSGTVTVNPEAGAKVSSNAFEGNNVILDDGKSAVVFASYVPFTTSNNVGTYSSYTSTAHSADFADYTVPIITFKLSHAGNICQNFTLSIPNNSNAVTFTGDNTTNSVVIGSISEGTIKVSEEYSWSDWYGGGVSTAAFTYKTETPTVIGSCSIENIAASVNDVVYTMELVEELFIRQENSAPPSIGFKEGVFVTPTNEQLTFAALKEVSSDDGREFTFTLPSADEYGYQYANVFEENEPTAWTSTTDWVAGTTYYAFYSGTSALSAGYPTNEESVGGWSSYQYRYTSRYDFTFDVYLKHSKTYERSASVKTYNAKFGLIGWTVNGKSYNPGDTITVSAGNTIAVPVIGEISGARVLLSEAVKTQTGTTYKDIYQYQEAWPGKEVTATGTAYGWIGFNQKADAQNSGKSAANTAAAKTENIVYKSGFTIVNGTSDLQIEESAIVEGSWN